MGAFPVALPASNTTRRRGSRRPRPLSTDEPRGFAGSKLLRKARKGRLGIAAIR